MKKKDKVEMCVLQAKDQKMKQSEKITLFKMEKIATIYTGCCWLWHCCLDPAKKGFRDHQISSEHQSKFASPIPVAVFPKYVRKTLTNGGFEDQFEVCIDSQTYTMNWKFSHKNTSLFRFLSCLFSRLCTTCE